MDSTLFKQFDNKTIFITGATGFIGGRLVELLAENTNAKIKVLVRDYGKAMRIGRYSIELIGGDLNDESVIQQAVQHCDYVFHCAYGNKGSAESRHKVNVDGTLNLLIASKASNVKALIFLSTVSVYGLVNSEYLNENETSNPLKNDAYASSKLEAERLVLDFSIKNKFHGVVLQPTAVYGPWAPSYVLRPLASLKTHVFPLINGGQGICNAVYVDDVCQAMLKAAITLKASGNKYLINGPIHFTWKEFYNALAAMVPGSELISVEAKEMKKRYRASVKKKPVYKIMFRLLKLNKDMFRELLQYKLFSELAVFAIKHLPDKIVSKLRGSSASALSKKAVKPILLLDPDSVDFFDAQTKISSAKAMKELNYTPEFDSQKSFSQIKQWASWYYSNT